MKPLFINSSPNTEFDDFLIAIKNLSFFFDKDNSKKIERFESQIEHYYQDRVSATAFDSARSSFLHILKSYGIGEGDEVIVPAFTCVVIVNPILWLGAKPVYVDIDPTTLNIDIEDLKNKITDKTKVILAQHTFGRILEIKKINEIASKKNIKVVEDCAHVIDSEIGIYSDAAIITFGITKVVSGVRGGMAITRDKNLDRQLKEFQKYLSPFPFRNNIRFLLNPIIWFLVKPIYYLGFSKLTLGKLIIGFFHLIGVLGIGNIVEPIENKGGKPRWIPVKMSANLADLASHQFRKLKRYSDHRKEITEIYSRVLGIDVDPSVAYLRFPVYVKDRNEVLEYFRTKGIMLGDWYKAILHIPKQNYTKLKYKEGTCPNAEYAASHLVNLPTFINVNKGDAEYIASEIKNYIDYNRYK